MRQSRHKDMATASVSYRNLSQAAASASTSVLPKPRHPGSCSRRTSNSRRHNKYNLSPSTSTPLEISKSPREADRALEEIHSNIRGVSGLSNGFDGLGHLDESWAFGIDGESTREDDDRTLGSANSAIQSTCDDDSVEESQMKEHRRRQQNAAASKRFRARRSQRQQDLESALDQSLEENEVLRHRNILLASENRLMKELLGASETKQAFPRHQE